MPIVLHCPKCGTRYDLGDDLAGKQAKCRCGQRIQVPLPAAEPAATPDDDTNQDQPGRPGAATESTAESLRSTVCVLAGAARPEKHPVMLWMQAVPMRTVVGILSIGYGSVMTLLLLGRLATAGSFGLWGLFDLFGLVEPFLAVLIVVGGVLILRGREHGPAFAGIACAILCFLPFIKAIQRAFLLLSAAQPGAFLWLLLRTALAYAIPVLIVVWAVREETRKQRESEQDL
jgi:hypothetical protein